MAQANCDVAEEEVLEILEEQFQQYFMIAFAFMRKLRLSMDRKICKKYLDKCLSLNKPDIRAKLNRNQFMKELLDVISESRIFEEENASGQIESVEIRVPRQIRQWSDDRRTFLAVKEIPDLGILVYMANSSEDHPTWDKFDLTSKNLTELNSKITFTS